MFRCPDPLAWEFANISPYVYSLNNPIKYFDPDGKRPMTPKEYRTIIAVIRISEQAYYRQEGYIEAVKDNGTFSQRFGLQKNDINVPIVGIEQRSMGLRTFLEGLYGYLNPFAEIDPMPNILQGKDDNLGGEIEVFVKKPKLMKISNIVERDNEGDAVIIHYTGEGGQTIIKLTMTREQYSKWQLLMQQYMEEGRKKQEEEKKKTEEENNE